MTSTAEEKAFLTAFNRAHARGQTLAHVLLSVKESPSDGYYAIDTYCAAAEPTPEEVETFKKTVLTAVLHGRICLMLVMAR